MRGCDHSGRVLQVPAGQHPPLTGPHKHRIQCFETFNETADQYDLIQGPLNTNSIRECHHVMLASETIAFCESTSFHIYDKRSGCWPIHAHGSGSGAMAQLTLLNNNKPLGARVQVLLCSMISVLGAKGKNKKMSLCLLVACTDQ